MSPTTYRPGAMMARAAEHADAIRHLTASCDAEHKRRTVRALVVARILGVPLTPGFVEEYRRFEERL